MERTITLKRLTMTGYETVAHVDVPFDKLPETVEEEVEQIIAIVESVQDTPETYIMSWVEGQQHGVSAFPRSRYPELAKYVEGKLTSEVIGHSDLNIPDADNRAEW